MGIEIERFVRFEISVGHGDATGRKLERIKKVNGSVFEDRVYDDGIEYNSPTAIDFIHTPEGRAIPASNTYNLQYQVTDHLGNIRALFMVPANNAPLTANYIVQTTDYYPFGREITYSLPLAPLPDNEYKYNGKEFQKDLAEYDYGARFYDPIVARWTAVDPLGEFTRRYSPYNYVTDNPVKFSDPTEMKLSDTTIVLQTVTIRPEESTASKIGHFLWGAVDYLPFASAIKQIGEGIYDGDWKEIALGTGSLVLDAVTGGEGSELVKVGEEIVEVAAEDEIKEGAEKALQDIPNEHHADPVFMGGMPIKRPRRWGKESIRDSTKI